MNTPSEAGPSRLSPARSPSPFTASLPENGEGDIVMEDATEPTKAEAVPAAENDEAVQLLLNISSALDVPSVLPHQALMEIVTDETYMSDKAPLHESPVYPFTPPDDAQNAERNPIQSEAVEGQDRQTSIPNDTPLPPPLPMPSLSEPPSVSHPPSSSSRASPEPPIKRVKQKRKRNAAAGPSRRASQEHPKMDGGDHPAHWLGEDNTIIRCICGFTEDDGFTIQCEDCGAWEHGICFGYTDEASAPDIYRCELCEPREVDAAAAKRVQLFAIEQARQAREAALKNGPTVLEKPRSRGKPKRARTESVMDGEAEGGDGGAKEASPVAMGPPAPKQRRNKNANKPRAKQGTVEPTPGPSSLKGQPIMEETEDDFFRIEPWALEFTPIKESLVRGVAARRLMRTVYREWVDAEEELSERHSRPLHNPSGLPSPTETGVLRLSPEHIFPPPDFSILAPPVPPAFLLGSDLEALAASTSVRLIEDSPSFLPLSYAENVLGHGIYTRPSIYGIFAEDPITTGSFVGEYRGEISDCETYRRDPINQYAALGLPKPHVRGIGPPVNLIIDARGYGSKLRFVRNGCHPNAVLRPFIWRKEADEPPKLKFGIFAAKDIDKKDEVILGWEWDDQHVVHSLRSAIHAAMLSDGSLAAPWLTASQKTILSLSSKFDAVLTHIFGTFTACACVVPGACALAQMAHIVDGRVGQGDEQDGKKKTRVDLGELIGAVRGWRRREMEVDSARKWEMPQMLDLQLHSLARSRSRSRSRSRTRTEDMRSENDSEGQDESMNMDLDDGQAAPSSPIVLSTKTPQKTPEKAMQPVMQMATPPSKAPSLAGPPASSSSLSSAASSRKHAVEDDLEDPVTTAEAVATHSDNIPDVEDEDQAEAMDTGDESDATTATIPKSQFSESEQEGGSDSDLTSADESTSAQPSATAAGIRQPQGKKAKPRRVLSPVIEQTKYFDPDPAASEEDEERELIVKKPKKVKKARLPDSSPSQVSRPSVKASKPLSTTTTPVVVAGTKKAKNLVSQVSAQEKKQVPPGATGAGPGAGARRTKQKRIVDSSDDEMDLSEPTGPIPGAGRRKSTKASKLTSPKAKTIKLERLEAAAQAAQLDQQEKEKVEEQRAVVPDQLVAPMSTAVDPLESLPDPETVPPVEQPALAESDSMVLDDKPATPDPEPETEAKEPTPPPEPPKKVSFSEYLKNHKFRKESQTPSVSATPAAEMTAATPAVESAPLTTSSEPITTAPTSPTAMLVPSATAIAATSATSDIPGFGAYTSQPQPLTTFSVKLEPDTPAASASTSASKLNLFDHLPSARPSASTTPATPATPLPSLPALPVQNANGGISESPRTFSTPLAATTPSSSYVPRQASGSGEYFPPQPPALSTASSTTISTPSYVPRAASSSYTPRAQSQSQSQEDTAVGSSSSFIPRQPSSTSEEFGASTSSYTPPKGEKMPPPLLSRDVPPHTPTPTPATSTTAGFGSRPPPTGPKVPPTGPRGLAGSGLGLGLGLATAGGAGPGNPAGGLGLGGGSTGAGSARGFGGARGYGGRGGWRGRGFRGGWRGS